MATAETASTALPLGIRERSTLPRRQTLLLLILIATLPFQWYALAVTGAGILRFFHLASLAFVIPYLARSGTSRSFTLLMKVAGPFAFVIFYWLIFQAVGRTFNGIPVAEVFQQAMYAVTALTIGAYFARISREGDSSHHWSLLRWSALIAVGSFLLTFGLSAFMGGVNPVRVLAQAVAHADPSVIQFQLFRESFTGIGENPSVEIRDNLRHEIFAAIVLAFWMSALARVYVPLRRRGPRVMYAASMLAALLLVALSLSRAIVLALLIGLAIPLLRSILSGRVSKPQMAGLVGVTFGTFITLITGFGEVIWRRFTDQSAAYSNRAASLNDALDVIGSNTLFGGATPTEAGRAHNFIVDSWASAGALAGVAAFVAVILLLAAFGSQLLKLAQGRGSAGIQIAMLGLVCLPVVRMFTAGGGVLHLTEWIALAVFAGVAAGQTPYASRSR